MIPKKIHFCWLSGDEYPPLIKHCINTWQEVLPDYEIILWDTKRFDINSVHWVKQAFEAQKYAFAADYIRFYAVYTEGGIYLDSDVEMVKSFNPLLQYKSFIGFVAATGALEAALFGAEAGSQWCGDILEFYKDREFTIDVNGGIAPSLFAPHVMGKYIHSIFCDFPTISPKEPIKLANGEILVCPSDYFSPIKYDIEKSYNSHKKLAYNYRKNQRTYCIHRFNAAWGIKPSFKVQLLDKSKKRFISIVGERLAQKVFDLARKMIKR